MKKVIFLNLAVLAVLSVLLFSGPAAADTESGGFTYTILEDGTAGITGCSLAGDIVIPAGIDGYTVTNLAAELFYGRRDVTSVSVPATVTFFGENAGPSVYRLYGVLGGHDPA